MTTPVYAITANSLTAETFRQAPSSLIAGTGVVGSADLEVTQNGTPNMSVNVAAGQVWAPGTLSSTSGFPTNLNAQTAYGLPSSFNEQGSYMSWLNGTTNLVIAAADATNPRIDLAVWAIQDAQYSGSNNQGILQVITGTAAPSPVAPSAPANSVVLAQISVPAAATSITTADITDKRPYLSVAGGIRPACRVYRAAAFNTGTSWGIFTFDTVNFDNRSGYSTSSGTYTCPESGVYLVSTTVDANAGSATDWIQAAIYHNGSQYALGPTGWDTISGGDLNTGATSLVECTVGDTLSVFFVANASRTGRTGSSLSYLSIVKASN